MSYRINLTDGTLLTSIEEGTVDQSTDLKLVGRYFVGYGEIQNENFVSLLENFANNTQPAKPLKGQLWYDTETSKIKFFDGIRWRSTSNTEYSSEQPTGLSGGDFWFDEVEEQLYAYNGENFILIGPEKVGPGITRIEPLTVKATDQESYSVITGIASTKEGDDYAFVASNSEFEIDHSTSTPLTDFGKIKKGITLAGTRYTDNGISDGDYIFWGTSAVAKGLLVNSNNSETFVDANEFLINKSTEVAEFGNKIVLSSQGLQIGDSETSVYTENEHLVIQNKASNSSNILFKLPIGSLDKSILAISNSAVTPGITSLIDMGTATHKWKDVHADRFVGVSSSSQNADLAEKYTTDREYPTGTIMSISTSVLHECHAAKENETAIGVISANPAYVMNSESSGQTLALKGRVPVRITGPVNKGDSVYLLDDGIASTKESSNLIGVALESSRETRERLIECCLKI